MNKRHSLLLMMLLPWFCMADTTPDLRAITLDYMKAKEAVQQKGSTAKDVEHMLSFMKDDIQTEHKPHVTLQCENDDQGKAGFREGLSHYLGKYESTEIIVTHINVGKNMTSVQFSELIRFERDGVMNRSFDNNLYILEFDGDKIQREFRYDLQ